MAIAPTSFALLFLITILFADLANSSDLAQELSFFVPACAERCFQSFLDVNYPDSSCGARPGLTCLCKSDGATGFTLGEGAVQCIAAEQAVGTCSSYEASEHVLQAAFGMCDNQPGAVQPTLQVITATLLLPSVSGGFVQFPPPSTTTTTTTRRPTNPFPTTLVTDTRPPPVVSSTSTRSRSSVDKPTTATSSEDSSTSTRRSRTSQDSSTSQATETSTSTSVPPPAETTNTDADADADGNNEEEDEEDEAPPLNTAQIAGISVGVAATAGLAIGAIILARYCRRRRDPDAKTGFLWRRSTWRGSFDGDSDKPLNQSPWLGHHINAPLDTTTLPPLPNYVRTPERQGDQRTSWGAEVIGLAISPPQRRQETTASPARRVSKLLPAKPDMPPMPPKKDTLPSSSQQSQQQNRKQPWQPQQRLYNVRPRQSPPQPTGPAPPLEQHPIFQDKPQPPAPLKLQIPKQKDLTVPPPARQGRESTLTEFEEDGRMSLSPNIWRPPSTALMSANTYYVADRNGNWVLADAAPESLIAEAKSATSTSQTDSGFGSGSKGSPPPAKTAPLALATKPSKPTSLAPPAEISRNGGNVMSMSSSIYSQPSPAPWPLFSSTSNPNPRRSFGPRRSLPRVASGPRVLSMDSEVTIIDSSSDESKGPTPPDEVKKQPAMTSQPQPSQAYQQQQNRQPQQPLQETQEQQRDQQQQQQLQKQTSLRPASVLPLGALSPVAESPRSPTGRSPVKYPDIRSRRIPTALPPQTRQIYYPPGQPSPTLGVMQQQQQQQQQYGQQQYRPPPGNRPGPGPGPGPGPRSGPNMPYNYGPGRNRWSVNNPGLTRTGSPTKPTMRMVEPSPEPEDRDYQASNNSNRPQQQQPPRQPYQNYPYPRQPAPSHQPDPTNRPPPQRFPQYPPGQNPPHQPPPNQNPPSFPRQRGPYPPLNTTNLTPAETDMPDPRIPQLLFRPRGSDLISPHSDYTNATTVSSNGSLLAKRLGTDRAAGMALPASGTRNSAQDRWRRRDLLSPPVTGGRAPPPGTPGNNLPATPTWVPRLTPTRRGEELFLNVQ